MYDYDAIEELSMVKLAKKQDAEAFARLYEKVYKDLYRFALCTMRHAQDAEDAVSEAVVKAYVNLPNLRKPESFRCWMFRILINVCKKKWMESSREELVKEAQEETAEPDYAQNRDVRDAFAAISEEEQVIVGLSVFGGYNSREIGELLTLNPNTVRSKRSRALEKMGGILK